MKKVLIFGIGGFVGRYLAQEFLSCGYAVYGSDKTKNNMLHENITYQMADILNPEQVSNLIHDVSPHIIVNLAAVSSVGTSWIIPQTTISVNVIGSLNIIEASRKCRTVPKIMFIGSSEEYVSSDIPITEKAPLNANNPYGISKITQERFAEIYREQYGMKIYCVRAFNHTGVEQCDSFVLPSFCKQVADIEKSGRPGIIKVGNLSAERDFSDVRDIVRAYRMIIESDNYSKIYNVGSGKSYSLKVLLDYIISLSNQNITIEVDPSRIRPIDTPRICCDYSEIEKDLGWRPKYSIFDTLTCIFEHYCNQRG